MQGMHKEDLTWVLMFYWIYQTSWGKAFRNEFDKFNNTEARMLDSIYHFRDQTCFLALTSAGPRGWCWNPSLKGKGFNDLRGLADVCVSQNHVWLLLLHKVILSFENFGKKLQKFIIMAHKSMKDS